MKTLEKLPQVKQMTTQLLACLIMHTAINLRKQESLDADQKAVK